MLVSTLHTRRSGALAIGTETALSLLFGVPTGGTMVVKILPNDSDTPPGKLADVELHFEQKPLAGLKLIGFAIWERRGKPGRNVTFPARQYSVSGERRSYALLRPVSELAAQDRLRAVILEAYAEHEAEAAVAK
jgi:hypothetical protein